MDQLGCSSTLYYVRKRGTWGCTSLFVSYLRIFCFHPKTRKFAFIRKQESLVLGGGANFWSWIGKLAIEICQIRQKRDKLWLSCSPLTYSFTWNNKSISICELLNRRRQVCQWCFIRAPAPAHFIWVGIVHTETPIIFRGWDNFKAKTAKFLSDFIIYYKVE
jgi:hypothetical protein